MQLNRSGRKQTTTDSPLPRVVATFRHRRQMATRGRELPFKTALLRKLRERSGSHRIVLSGSRVVQEVLFVASRQKLNNASNLKDTVVVHVIPGFSRMKNVSLEMVFIEASLSYARIRTDVKASRH